MHNDRDKKFAPQSSTHARRCGLISSVKWVLPVYQSVVSHISQFEREAHDTRAEARSLFESLCVVTVIHKNCNYLGKKTCTEIVHFVRS